MPKHRGYSTTGVPRNAASNLARSRPAVIQPARCGGRRKLARCSFSFHSIYGGFCACPAGRTVTSHKYLSLWEKRFDFSFCQQTPMKVGETSTRQEARARCNGALAQAPPQLCRFRRSDVAERSCVCALFRLCKSLLFAAQPQTQHAPNRSQWSGHE